MLIPFCRELSRHFYFLPLSSMFHVNRITLLGTVTSDTVSFDDKTRRAIFTLETKKMNRNRQAAVSESHVVVCNGPLSHFAVDRLAKSSALYLEGHLSTLKGGESVIVADRLVLLATQKN